MDVSFLSFVFPLGDSPEYRWLPAKPSATIVGASNEPALAATSWIESVPRGFALLDCRPARDSKSRLCSAVKAIGDGDTVKAHRLLSQEIAEHGVEMKGRVDCHEDLRRVAEGDAVIWTRLITAAGFPLLSPGELYDIVRLQPEATRTAEDEGRLAQAAVGAHRIPAALEHLERCARIAEAESMPLEACSLGVALALDANDSAAVKLAGEAKHAAVAHRLLWLQADASKDPEQVAEWTRQVIQSPYRPGSGLAGRFERLNQLNQPKAVVSIIEWMMRRDERLDVAVIWELGAAYKTLGRFEDALRTR